MFFWVCFGLGDNLVMFLFLVSLLYTFCVLDRLFSYIVRLVATFNFKCLIRLAESYLWIELRLESKEDNTIVVGVVILVCFG